MSIEQKTKLMRRYVKTLGKVIFTIQTKNGVARVKFGRKTVIADCPDRPAAENLMDGLNAVLRGNQAKTDAILDYLAQQCEQMSLNNSLFPKEEPHEAQGISDQQQGHVSDSAGAIKG